MLRACRTLLRPGGRTAFLSIEVRPGLSPSLHRRAVRLGPRSVAADRQAADMMRRVGFAEVIEVDVTADFLETARAWLHWASQYENGLRATLGDELFDQQQSDRRDLTRGIEGGLLQRVLVAGTSPVSV